MGFSMISQELLEEFDPNLAEITEYLPGMSSQKLRSGEVEDYHPGSGRCGMR